MNMPAFTAEGSLYRTSNNYRSPALDRTRPRKGLSLSLKSEARVSRAGRIV